MKKKKPLNIEKPDLAEMPDLAENNYELIKEEPLKQYEKLEEALSAPYFAMDASDKLDLIKVLPWQDGKVPSNIERLFKHEEDIKDEEDLKLIEEAKLLREQKDQEIKELYCL